MHWNSPNDAMPWVGLYAGVASLLCTLAMAADVFHGFRQRKLWFPCRFFTLNAASLTLIAIAMKLPVDLTTDISDTGLAARGIGVIFLITMLANFLPSLGLMDDKELLTNIIALGILVITITGNVCIEDITRYGRYPVVLFLGCFHLLWFCSVASTVPTSRRILELKYQEMQRLASGEEERKFSSEELIQDVKKYWMMTGTGNIQFVIACSPICCASGFICLLYAWPTLNYMLYLFGDTYHILQVESDYRWSIYVIIVTQSIGVLIGTIAPFCRCFSAFSYKFSKKRSMNHLNVFRVEKYWTQRLKDWKHSRVDSCIPGLHCKKVVHDVKNMALNICVGLQIIVVVKCKTVSLVPNFLVFLFSSLFYCCEWLVKRFKNKTNSSGNDVKSEVEEHASYVLQIEEEVNLSNKSLRRTLKSITRLICKSEKQEPSNLLKLLQKSTGWKGVVEFDDDQVPPLHPEEILNSWSLVVVTLTAIAIALPKIESRNVKVLLASMSEGLSFVSHIEENLNAKGDLVNIRKVAQRVWTDVQLHCKWLQIDLQKKARKGKTSQEILQWLGDEAVKIVIHSKQSNNQIHVNGLHRFVAANLMYRISQTILLHCNGQESWPNDEELFEKISTMIADILCACFTNLPCLISMKCYESAIEKWEESIRTAAQLLGNTKKILSILQQRELPTLNLDSMAYIHEWHALLKSQNSIASASSTSNLPASSSSGELAIVTTV